jgi:hypothetical protein
MDIMLNLAWQFDVPAEHIQAGRTEEAPVFDRPWLSFVRVQCTEEPIETAVIAVRNRGYWFSLDDCDMASKRTFTFLQLVLSLADTGGHARGPVVSL